MPNPKLKLVKVPDLGIVAFPDSMPDDQIGAAIKKHATGRAKPSFMEQVEQVKPVGMEKGEGFVPSLLDTTFGNIGGSLIGAIHHPIQTVKGGIEFTGAMMEPFTPNSVLPANAPARQEAHALRQQFVKQPGESWGDYIGRLEGQAYAMVPFMGEPEITDALHSRFIAPEEIPTRVNTRVAHVNPMGEVRVGADNIPTVWLHPKGWAEYMKVANPEVANPHQAVGESVALDPAFVRLATNPDLGSSPEWAHVQELLKKAHAEAPNKSAVLIPRSGRMSAAVKVLREEKIHAWQRMLSQNGDITKSLSPQAFSDLYKAVPQAMRQHLDPLYGDASRPMYVTEAAARYIANDLHGTQPYDVVQFLSKYFDAVIQQHGPDALAALEHTRGLAKHIQGVIDEEYRSADRAAAQGSIRGVQERGPGSVASVTPQAPATTAAAAGVERRINPILRKRIDQMSPEEMRHLLLNSHVVDLPNKRAFDEAQAINPSPSVAMSDADGLKAFNDKFGYQAGDELLKAKAEALKQAGLDAYHDKGDEFRFRGASAEELRNKLEHARNILRNKEFDVTMDDGRTFTLKGVDFSYGTGADISEAERGLHADKQAREQRGERRRGELAGITSTERENYQNSAPPEFQPAYSAATTPAALREEAFRRNPENWIRAGAEEFSKQFGRYLVPQNLTPDARAMEIADAYEAMQHNPSDPRVQASYQALKRDIRQQWDYATHNMGVKFEPFPDPSKQYPNSAAMAADVRDNHHLYFYQGGEMPSDHPLAEVDPETGYSSNDMLRAVHDLFGHAMEAHQFGASGEESAFGEHWQMFSPEALPALTTETKGQNSWVNFGPNMRDAQGNLIQPGQPGYLAAKDRPYAQQKAGLLPERYHHRLDEPISFVSPNTFQLGSVVDAERRFSSIIHVQFGRLAQELAKSLGLNARFESSLGSWHGGAENSYLIHYPIGTNPELMRYYEANLGILGDQFAVGHFIPDENGPHLGHFFWVDADRDKIASIMLKHGIDNATITPDEGGYRVTVAGDPSLSGAVGGAKKELGVSNVGKHAGRAEFPGGESRAEARRNFRSILEKAESNAPDWRRVREAFESRPDYHHLHRLIERTKEPFIEATHGSDRPNLVEISPEKFGTNPYKAAEAKRKAAYPDIFEDRSYFQIKGTRGEPYYEHRPNQYRALFNSENIYPFVDDPDDLKSLIPANLFDQAGRTTAYEKIIKENGYDGFYTPDGVVQVFKGTPAEAILKNEGMFSRRQRTWRDIKPYLTKDELERHNTPEKQQKLVDAVNSMPDAEEWDAAVKAGLSGSLWYERSSRAFDALVESQPDMFQPEDKDKFLNFVAALSPVQPVRQNLLMAINMWDKWNRAGRPTDVQWEDEKNFKGVKNKSASLYQIMKGRVIKDRITGKPRKSLGVDLPSRLYNGIRALQDEPMSGPKVNAFAPNLGSDVNRSTNDTWIAVLANVDPAVINRPHYYDAVSAMVREAGEKNGIPARQAQAAAWSFIKALAEMSGWGESRWGRDVWRPPETILKRGYLTPDLINEHAADFADMLANDYEIRARIKDIGGDLDALDRRLGKYVPERPAVEPEPASAILTRLLGAARRLETARHDAKIQSHLAAKVGQPSLFDTEFSPEKMEAAFSRQNPFYLKSEKIIDDKMKGPMTGDDLHRMLENNGVKPEEMKWIGIDDFLKSKGKEKVTPEEAREHLAANNLQIHEVMKGTGGLIFHQSFPTQEALMNVVNGDEMLVDKEGKLRKGLAVEQSQQGWNLYDSSTKENPTKFGSYVLPGGENYRELLLTMPPRRMTFDQWRDMIQARTGDRVPDNEAERKAYQADVDYRALREGADFRSSHWDEPNVVGHVRFNDRTGPNGEKLLHLEELQSDWHQKGRAQGYDNPPNPLTSEERAEQLSLRERSQRGDLVDRPEAYDRYLQLTRRLLGNKGVPDAPFKKTWPEFLMKRMIRYASENGYDGISWTPGEEQAARYDLSKQVDNLEYFPRTQRLNGSKEGHHVLSEVVPPEKLPDYIGKEAARKLLESTPTKTKFETDYEAHHVLSGTDLKVGGEGMKGFYDKIVPEVANKLGKQFGAKVGETNLVTETKPKKTYVGPSYTAAQLKEIADQTKGTMIEGSAQWVADAVKQGSSMEEAMDAYGSPMLAEKLGGSMDVISKKEHKTVPYFPITDSMRESAMEHGQPLFHRDDSGVVTYFDQDNFSTRRTTGHNMLDPESIISGAELAAGFTYNNSHRVFRDQAQYDAVVSGQIPAYELPNVAPRRLNAKKSLSEPEKNELFLLEGKKWRSVLTPDEQQRYYNLSDRDLAGRYGIMLSAGAQKQLDEYRNTQEHIQALKAKAAEMNGQPVR